MRTGISRQISDVVGWLNGTSATTKWHAASIAAILAFTLILFAPVLRGRTFSMVGAHMFVQYPWITGIKSGPDVEGQGYMQTDHAEVFYPTSVFATNAIRSGQFPMWFPYSFSGIPVMEVGLGYGLLYPPKLLAATVLSPIRQHDFILFTHLLLAGLGMYALLRCWGANALGAVMGAIVWEMNGHNALFLTFQHPVIAAAWFPLMMLGATLAIRKQSIAWAVTTGAALGMSLLGNIYLAYVSSWMLVSWYFVLTVLAARKLFLKGQRRAAVFCLCLPLISAAVSLALGAAAWLTLLGALSTVTRGAVSLRHQLSYLVTWQSLLRGLLLPVSAGGMAHKPPDFAAFAFVGTPALIFALAGFLRRSAPALFVSIAGLVSVGIILGFTPLIHVLRLVLPQFAAMHLRAGFFPFCFAVAALAAFGITEAGRYFQGNQRHLAFKIGLPLIAIQAFQLILFVWIVNPNHTARPEWLFPATPLITSLQAHQGEFHILPVYLHVPGDWKPPMMAGNVAGVFDLRSGSGYESILPLTTTILWQTVESGGVPHQKKPPPSGYRPYFNHDQLPVDLLEKLSVGLIATQPYTEPRDADGSNPVADGSLRLIYQAKDGWVYKLQHALPRAFLVPQVLAVPDPEAALRTLVDKNFDARQAAIVIGEDTAARTGLPSFDSSPVEPVALVNIVSDRVNDVEIQVNTSRAGVLVLNDSWDRGWKALVDGAEQPVLRVNYAFRGVVVPQGLHRVTFLYRPPLLLLALGISGVALMVLVIVFAWIGIRWLRGFRQKPNGQGLEISADEGAGAI